MRPYILGVGSNRVNSSSSAINGGSGRVNYFLNSYNLLNYSYGVNCISVGSLVRRTAREERSAESNSSN